MRMICSTVPSPWPPCSSPMKMPGQPSSQSSRQVASSYWPASASSRTRSIMKRSASSSFAVRLIACWSSEKSKFTRSPPYRSFGRPSTRSATMFLRISVVPPSIELARERSSRYVQGDSQYAPSSPRIAQPGALVHERLDRPRPAVADAADHVLVRDPRLLHEELVELRLLRDLVERPDLHGLLLHVEDEVGQALMLGRVLVRPRHEHAPLRLVRVGGPDLLAGHEPLAACARSGVRLDRLRLQRGEIGARLRLGEALAPDLLAREDRLEPALLLLVRAVRDHHRAAHHHAEDVDRWRRLGARHLLAEEGLLDERGAAAAVLLRPGEARVAGVVEPALPGAAVLELGVVAGRVLTGGVLGEPGPQLVAGGLFGGGEREVHEGQ